MNAKLTRLYRAFRGSGMASSHALIAARTEIAWDRAESAGLVRLVLRSDSDYDPSGLEGAELEAYQRDGAVGVNGQFTVSPGTGADDVDSDRGWLYGGGVWGFVGYRDAANPLENWYVTDIKRETLDDVRRALSSRCPCCRRAS